MANPAQTASQSKATLLQRYHEKLPKRLAQARANNLEAASRKALAERGAVSPLGGVAVQQSKERKR